MHYTVFHTQKAFKLSLGCLMHCFYVHMLILTCESCSQNIFVKPQNITDFNTILLWGLLIIVIV